MDHMDHEERHRMLHRHFDELVADWVVSTGAMPSKCTVLDLMRWSAAQALSIDQPCPPHRE